MLVEKPDPERAKADVSTIQGVVSLLDGDLQKVQESILDIVKLLQRFYTCDDVSEDICYRWLRIAKKVGRIRYELQRLLKETEKELAPQGGDGQQ